MTKLKYKPVAIQNECWGTEENSRGITVLVKYLAQGKIRIYEKKEAFTFSTAKELERFINKNKIKVISEKKFKPNDQDKLLHLLKAV